MCVWQHKGEKQYATFAQEVYKQRACKSYDLQALVVFWFSPSGERGICNLFE